LLKEQGNVCARTAVQIGCSSFGFSCSAGAGPAADDSQPIGRAHRQTSDAHAGSSVRLMARADGGFFGDHVLIRRGPRVKWIGFSEATGGTRAGPPQNFALAGFPRSPGRSALVTGEGRATRPQNLGIRLVERTRQRRRFHRVPGVCVSYLTLPR
jgi:hypothetical protein